MNLAERDARVIWHPFTQMQTQPLPVPIVSGQGAYLFDGDGCRLIDGISSWWVNMHGHCHPHLIAKIHEQMQVLDHVIFAGFTHPKAVELAERLLPLLPGQARIFFSDNGSTAVEVALKMAIQYWHNQGKKRSKIVCFEGSYHGDTFGAMSVSARATFTRPFSDWLFDVITLPIPTDGNFTAVATHFAALCAGGDVAAFIFEPLVQGAGGFIFYDAAYLDQLIAIGHDYGVLAIADEVMTGFGRTGTLFAVDSLQQSPDLICLAKGLTGGTLPLALTSCSQAIYEGFLDDDRTKAFFHGHSYTANPIACAAACASLDLLLTPESSAQRQRLAMHFSAAVEYFQRFPHLSQIRSRGTIFAARLQAQHTASYFHPLGAAAAKFFRERGVLIRPLGDTFYLLPPYCVSDADVALMFRVLEEFLNRESD